MGTAIRKDFITGMGQFEENFITILNINQVFNTEELFELASSHEDQEVDSESG